MAKTQSLPELVFEFSLEKNKLNPEAMILFEKFGQLSMLGYNESLTVKAASEWESMEGEYRKNGTTLNTYLANSAKKTLRGIWLELENRLGYKNITD